MADLEVSMHSIKGNTRMADCGMTILLYNLNSILEYG